MTTVNMLEAKTSLSKLVEAVESGAESEIIIARNGRPAAKLVPLEESAMGNKRKLGKFAGQLPVVTLEQLNELDGDVARLFGVEP